jgi:HSP20 family protein
MNAKEIVPRDKGLLADRWMDEPFTELQRSINQELERFTRRFGVGLDWDPGFSAPAMPTMNVTEKDGVVHVEADLPGLEAKDIDVSVTDDLLTLKGERKEEKEEKGTNTFRRECRYGAFKRTVQLPARVQAEKVRAAFTKGVLKIDLPVAPEDKRRVQKIAIQAE